MRLIGLAGKARTGKDSIGEHLWRFHNFERYAFAAPLKRAVCEMFGIDMSYFGDEKKEVVIPAWGYSPRQMAQLLGTEGGRRVFGNNLWIKRAAIQWDRIRNARDDLGQIYRGMVITDVRFENEADWVRSEGGTIWHIERPGAPSVSAHVSELGVSFKTGDTALFNSTSLDDLYNTVDHLV